MYKGLGLTPMALKERILLLAQHANGELFDRRDIGHGVGFSLGLVEFRHFSSHSQQARIGSLFLCGELSMIHVIISEVPQGDPMPLASHPQIQGVQSAVHKPLDDEGSGQPHRSANLGCGT